MVTVMQSSTGLTNCNVTKWVADIFRDENAVPDMEVNDECIEVLKKLMFLSQESEKDASEVSNTDLYLTDFYTKQISLDDSIIDFHVKNLPNDYKEQVQLFSSIVVQLSLKQPTLTNFLLSFNSLENKSQHHLEESIMNLYFKSKYSKKTRDLNQNMIERKIEQLEKIVSNQRAIKPRNLERTNFVNKKSKEYYKKIKKQQEELNGLGFNPSLSHSELVKKANEVNSLKKSVQHLKAKVDKYQNLPPNEKLVRFKVEELKTKLLEKEKEFKEFLESYN